MTATPGICLPMSKTCAAVLLFAATLPLASAQSTIPELLQQAELTPNDVRIQDKDLQLLLGPSQTNPVTTWLLNAPLRSGDYALTLAQSLQNKARQTPDAVLGELSRLTGTPLRRNLLGDWQGPLRSAAAKENALTDVLGRLGGRVGRDELAAVPASVQEAAALILLAVEKARPWQTRAAESVGDVRVWRLIEAYLRTPLPDATQANGKPKPELEQVNAVKAAIPRFDLTAALYAAQELALAVSAARDLLLADASLGEADFEVRLHSPLGMIVLAGASDHIHPASSPTLLIIDTGGADEYAQAGANADRKHGLSVALDLAGNDTYRADPQQLSAFGAGVGGVGLLWDEAGDDVYEASRRTQGAGVFGIGMLIDGGGDDLYHATASAQAHAYAGIGLLIERGGIDYYEAFRRSQGYGGPRGAAALIDLAGNDRYVANDSDIRFPSPQDAQHNASLSQGAGVGERADYSDGHSLPGGVGILLDVSGDDAYECGVFGQGVGYWEGTGLLLDLAGNDQYRGHWYVQGSGAHFAVGVLYDRDGDDEYIAARHMSHGAGHDLSVGYLEDVAGNDTYRGNTLALGAANAAGVGIFIDRDGNDNYTAAAERTFGWTHPTSSYRNLMPAFGLFFDLGGTDTYEGRVGPADGYLWTDPDTKAGVSQRSHGYGFDVE